VKPPQRGHGVEQDMLNVDGQIERDDGRHDCEPVRNVERMQEAPAARANRQRDANPGKRKQQAHKHSVNDDHAKIPWPAAPPSDRLRAPRPEKFPEGHRNKDANEGAQSNAPLADHQGVTHVGLLCKCLALEPRPVTHRTELRR
jgi:hypothetical protein